MKPADEGCVGGTEPRVFTDQRSLRLETLLYKCAHSAWRKRAALRKPLLLLQVVADAGDGAVHVDVGEGPALRGAHSGGTAGDLRQLRQVLC